jgi:CheY-like chemotaxis protein
MNDSPERANGRILIIDDNPDIHRDFEKILLGEQSVDAGMSRAEEILFGDGGDVSSAPLFEIEFATQGKQGVSMVERAAAT